MSSTPTTMTALNAPTPSPARTLLDAAGLAFLLTGFLGRLPAAMNQLGMLLIVSASGRGLGLAGSTVAAVGLGTAAGAPLVGRLADRIGPVRVLAGAMTLQTLALAGVLASLTRGWSGATVLACAALLGAANPQAGSVARACWSALARRGDPARTLRTLRLGLGFETAADETSYVIGPVAAGALVTLLGAEGAVGALMVSTLAGEGLFALWLARHRDAHPALGGARTEDMNDLRGSAVSRPSQNGRDAAPHGVRTAADHTGAAGAVGSASAGCGATARPPSPPTARSSSPLAPAWGQLAPVLAVVAAVGVVFGSTQTALTAVHTAAGTPGLTGPVYGSMGVTSALAGLVAPSLRASERIRIAVGGSLVLVCSALLMAVPPTAVTVLLVLAMGAGVGTTLATAYTLVEAAAPAGGVTGVMTVAATCNVLGVSAGSLVTGAIGTHLHLANLPAVVAGAVVSLVALGALRRRS